MAKGPEVRLSMGALIAVIAIIGVFWYFGSHGTTGTGTTGNVVNEGGEAIGDVTVAPMIEKTKVYASTYDAADYEGEKQLNRVAGTADLIKSGNVLETITTTTTSGAASAVEMNGNDAFQILGHASGYYAKGSDMQKVTETNQPISVKIRDAATPTVTLLDENKNTISEPYIINLSTNDVSKTYYIRIERPGDDTYYQFCEIAADFNDDYVQVQVLDNTGSFNKGVLDLVDKYDMLHNVGADAVWSFGDATIKDYDQKDIAFLIKTAKDVNPFNVTETLFVVDCEENLQNGKIVYGDESSSDADVGLSNLNLTITTY
jgi:hypothetical protein